MHGRFTSESVAAGHPDKLCDRVSDAVLDAYLEADPQARVACEAAAGPGWLIVFGEVRSSADVDVEAVACDALARAGFDPTAFDVHDRLVAQSPEIAAGVDRSLEARHGSADELDALGAGDQGLMFGFACDETPELMPLSLMLSHAIVRRLPAYGLGPDGKAQVTVDYPEGRPRVVGVLVSAQHLEAVSQREVRARVTELVHEALEAYGIEGPVDLLVNPSGSFVLGGPDADAGLTGRKIIVDSYGGHARHGGGAFSGKDPSKVDRSAAYALRRVAKTIVAAGLARRAEVQAAYAIGRAAPVSLAVETFGSSSVDEGVLALAVSRTFDLRPAAIIRDLDLRRPGYEPLTVGGHFGRSGVAWEDRLPVAELRAAVDEMAWQAA